MFDPSLLRNKSLQAVARLERERFAEEERLRHEAEARRKEEEQQRQRAEHLTYLRKQARLTSLKLLRQAIQTAANGGKSTRVVTNPEVIPYLQEQVEALGFRGTLICESRWKLITEERVEKLLHKLGNDASTATYRDQMYRDSASGRTGVERLLKSIDNLKSDSAVQLTRDAETYIRLVLKPHLESVTVDSNFNCFEIKWKAENVSDVMLRELRSVPSWAVSTSGAGLMRQISTALEQDALRGQGCTSFELRPLKQKPERWGLNTMTNYIHRGQPIGVCPFPAEVMLEVFRALEFDAVLARNSSPFKLTVSW